MPHISILISASSSMTRISSAIACRFHCRFDRLESGGQSQIGLSEDEAHPRAAALAVLEDQLAGMFFHDLLDDREAEAGALGAGRDIGLGQAVAAIVGQAAAVIL